MILFNGCQWLPMVCMRLPKKPRARSVQQGRCSPQLLGTSGFVSCTRLLIAIVRTLRIIPLEVGNLMCQCMFTAKDSETLMQDLTRCSRCRIPCKTFHKSEGLLLTNYVQ